MAIEITRSEHTASELRREAARTEDCSQARQLLALALVMEGASRTQAARRAVWTDRRCATGCIATTRKAFADLSTAKRAVRRNA